MCARALQLRLEIEMFWATRHTTQNYEALKLSRTEQLQIFKSE